MDDRAICLDRVALKRSNVSMPPQHSTAQPSISHPYDRDEPLDLVLCLPFLFYLTPFLVCGMVDAGFERGDVRHCPPIHASNARIDNDAEVRGVAALR
jgi:hypothetical protein